MISPDYAAIFVLFAVLYMIALATGWAKGDLSGFAPRPSASERRKKHRETLVGCAGLLALGFMCMVGMVSYNVFIRGQPAPTAQAPRAVATPAPPVPARPAPRPVQLPPSRPAHLLGGMTDGCSLLKLEDIAAVLGHPLAYDASAPLASRDKSIHCAYVDRPVRHPQRPRQEVRLEVERNTRDFTPWGSPIPDAPEDRRWRQDDAGEGVSVAIPTARGLRIVVQVALRHLKLAPQKRTEAERNAALGLALLAHGRASTLNVDALTPVPKPTLVGSPALPEFLRSWDDVVHEEGSLSERSWRATLEPLYALRARFGTRVKVIVLAETPEPRHFASEALARAVEEAFEVGRADTSPRRDGALVVIDTAARRAWLFLGPGAPNLTLANKRPLPLEWQGKDLVPRGPGIAARISALAAAYTRAYQRLGVSGPPEA